MLLFMVAYLHYVSYYLRIHDWNQKENQTKHNKHNSFSVVDYYVDLLAVGTDPDFTEMHPYAPQRARNLHAQRAVTCNKST